jgi:lipopolysaccharide/colanic/teichoic acid biosynthesis glycosyltransferase
LKRVILKRGIPRPLEFMAALIGLIVFSPVLLLISLAVKCSSPGPIFFRQKRVGQKGRLFILYKFRTMNPANQGPQVTAKGDPRITGIGNILRKTKMDELPELWNIFRGDLSLVGPRPEVPRYVDLKAPLWQKILETCPGLTDPVTLKLRNEEELLAQVEGDQEEFYLKILQPLKLKGYNDYLENRNMWTDIKVLWQSLLAVILPGRTPPPSLDEIDRLAGGSQQRANISTTAVKAFKVISRD